MRVLAVLCGVSAALSAAPIAGFRPPSIPLFSQSPLVNVWTSSDSLAGSSPEHWTGTPLDMFAAVRVDGAAYLLMGDATRAGVEPAPAPATQLWARVRATQSTFGFAAGGVFVNLTFTSPKLTVDWDLFSRPAHYLTFDVSSADGGSHAVSLYADVTANVVMRRGGDVAWQRAAVTGVGAGSLTALRMGAASQAPLADANDALNWGIAYLLADLSAPGASGAIAYSNATRGTFLASGALPPDAPASPTPLSPGGAQPATGPQVGVDRPGLDMPGSPFTLPSPDYNLCWAQCNKTAGCKAWAYAIPKCDSYAQPTCWLKSDFPDASAQSCRVSGAQAGAPAPGKVALAAAVAWSLPAVTAAAPASRFVTFAVDEVLSIDWFGEPCPPYWRRLLPINDSSVVPSDMLAAAHVTYAAVRVQCDEFDDTTARMLSAAGGDQYSTLTQTIYRQALGGGSSLVWVPSKAAAWFFVKEISSCGCLQTADVIYPFFPIILFYSPEFTKLMVLPHLEYAMNLTSQPYPLAWAPHHLGFWPLANLPYTSQENMPLEETSWFLLIIAAIAQRQGGDVQWLQPYWPAMETWYTFLVTLLPFPQEQLSTDDFDGPLNNATNLAIKGVAAIASWGYIIEQFTGNATAGAGAYALAAEYSNTMMEYAWVGAGADQHFMLGYLGSTGDCGNPASWPMIYNALWLRLLGFTALLPNQTAVMTQQAAWYTANVMQEFGLPLNSRKLYTKVRRGDGCGRQARACARA